MRIVRERIRRLTGVAGVPCPWRVLDTDPFVREVATVYGMRDSGLMELAIGPASDVPADFAAALVMFDRCVRAVDASEAEMEFERAKAERQSAMNRGGSQWR